jgi:hypothetical protein
MRLMINVEGGVPHWTSLTTEKGGSGRGVAGHYPRTAQRWVKRAREAGLL